MLRRDAVAMLAGIFARAAWASTARLDRFLGTNGGAALLVDVRTRELIAVGEADRALRILEPPGSTLKPFVLAALLQSGKLRADASFACPGRLRIGSRVLDCSHPRQVLPMQVDTALAYSCNCFVAHAAEKFAPGELARELERAGLASRSGWSEEEASGNIRPAVNSDAQRLQALGENGVAITLAELALAYRQLALKIDQPETAPILTGLEGAVEFGTAQNARLAGVRVAGKTGSVLDDASEPIAWFAGFVPSRKPEAVVAVMLPGRSGGADAAPVAGKILAEYRAGRL